MAKSIKNRKSEGFNTGIDTIDQVLGGGIRCIKYNGILGVIFGSAGTGKSTLGLQLCCRFLVEKSKIQKRKRNDIYSAIFITHENPELIKKKIDDFGCFKMESDKTNYIQADKIFETEVNNLKILFEDNNKKYQLHIIQIPFEENRQTPILENVFDTLLQRIRLIKSTNPYGNVLVCIDNFRTVYSRAILSAMSSRETKMLSTKTKDKYEQNKVYLNFYKQLHEYCEIQGLHTFLVIEEDIPESADPDKSDISSRPEVYAADLVIRLGIHSYELGHRERFFQIIKAKNQFYYRGKHHCSIVSKYGGGRTGEDGDFGLVVYPSIPMKLSLLVDKGKNQNTPINETNKPDTSTKKFFRLGIASLDSIVEKEINREKNMGYIMSGTNSVLVSDLDIKATEIPLHFAMNKNSRGLYISFMHKKETVHKIACRYWNKNRINSQMTIIDFPPEYISEHKLLRDIDRRICDTQARTPDKQLLVVLDNVFELQCKYPLIRDARNFLAALLELFSKRKVTSLVVDTVEVGEGRNPIESSVAAGLADNVFLLRHVEFHSKPHRVFSILKLVGVQTPDNLWDLIEAVDNKTKLTVLEAQNTFALYKNVLTGRPEPVTITMSFYIDEKGSPFHEYLKAHIESLKQTFGESLNINLYGAEEYARVHGFLTTIKRPPRGDCHIVALDEFWLKDLIANDLLEDISRYVPDQGKRDKYVCAAHDIALYKEIEPKKKEIQKLKKELQKEKLEKHFSKWYAVPARNNCGILCFNNTLAKNILGNKISSKVKNWLDDPINKTISWDKFSKMHNNFNEWSKNKKKTGEYPTTFFTFCMDQIESCVCFLLELALSYDKDKSFLKRDGTKLSLTLNLNNFPIRALQTFISLLDSETLRQLASGRFRASKNEPAALFSRQWMSTLGCLHFRNIKKKKDTSLGITILPDYDGYFETLDPYPLPVGLNRIPTPLSGTWYVGILKGSTAVEIGVGLIQQFTSVRDELYKLNNYMGFPVTEEFYSTDSYRLPYAVRFKNLAKVQANFTQEPQKKSLDNKYRKEMQTSDLLYRVLIEDYPHLTPILWRLMINTANAALIAYKGEGLYNLPESQLKKLRKKAANEYLALKSKK